LEGIVQAVQSQKQKVRTKKWRLWRGFIWSVVQKMKLAFVLFINSIFHLNNSIIDYNNLFKELIYTQSMEEYKEWYKGRRRHLAVCGLAALMLGGTSGILCNSNQKIDEKINNYLPRNSLENKEYVQKLEDKKDNQKDLAITLGVLAGLSFIVGVSSLGTHPEDP